MKTISIRFSLLFSLITILVNQSSAQPYVQLLNLKMQYFPAKEYVDETTDKMSMMQYQGDFLLPLEQKNKDVILIGGNYTQMNFTRTGTSPSHSTLYSTSLALGYEKRFSDKWKMAMIAIPKINSDFKDISNKDWQYGGIALATYKKKENLKYHFGFYYNKEYFGDFIVPLIGIDWKVNKRFNIFGDLPANMNAEYKLTKSFYVGASYLSIVSSYRLSSSSHNNDFVRVGDKAYGHNEFKGYINYYITKNIVWYAEGGYTAGRTYQLFDEKNNWKANDVVYRRNANGPFANTGVAINFRLDEK